jgi:DNA-directed RNA polymerase specialized sigma24 family protein
MPEPAELVRARDLLGRFEAEMGRPEAAAHLSEALSLLAEVRDDAESESVARVATNLAMAYARKIQTEVEELLSREPLIHLQVIAHWQKTFAAFESAGFALPEAVAAARSRLTFEEARKAIRQLSPAQRQELLQQLQAMDE